jgi:hypothetical protein
MRRTILGLSLACGLVLANMAGAAFAGQQTVRTGPRGNTQTTTRSVVGNQQQTVRTGPAGNTQTTTRSVVGNQQQTVRTGPRGNTQTTTRTVNP